MYKHRSITKTTSWPKLWGPFLSASKLLPELLYRLGCVYISDTIGWYSMALLKESPVGIVISSLCHLYSFTLIIIYSLMKGI